MTDAAARAGVHRRTVRRWASAGTVVSRLEELEGHQVRLIRADSLPAAPEGITPDSPEGIVSVSPGTSPQDAPRDSREGSREGSPGESALVLQVRLEAAQEARQRAEEAHRETRGELGRVVAEVEFLRAQVQQRADAERELRLLLASAQQAIQAITDTTTRPALEPAPAPARRARWWSLWSR